MLPPDAPSIAINASADTVTISGTLSWERIDVPDTLGLSRATSDFEIVMPYRGSPFDPDFTVPSFVGDGAQLPGKARVGVVDPKSSFGEIDRGTVDWGLYRNADPSLGIGPQGLLFERYVVTDSSLGLLDASQYYFVVMPMTADYSAFTAVNASYFVEQPLIGTDFFSEELYGDRSTFSRPATVADYRDANGLGGGGGVTDGTPNDDRLNFGSETDPISVEGGRGDDTIRGGRSDDNIDGGAGNDNLRGGRGNDTAAGGSGNDQLRGQGGNDALDGNGGDDRLWGNGGTDLLDGGGGDDTIRGGGGNDTLEGGSGDDILSGNGGGDHFVFEGRWGDDVLTDFDPRRDSVEIGGEVSTLRAFLAQTRDVDGSAVYDRRADGINTITFEGLSRSDLTDVEVSFV